MSIITYKIILSAEEKYTILFLLLYEWFQKPQLSDPMLDCKSTWTCSDE